jgi:1-acyl-sn-glycerol-3-phosphate acyltransferase
MRSMHHIQVDRAAGETSMTTALDYLKAGEAVGIFPEATISRSFELKDFKAGAVRMAAEAGVPVLPTVIWGSQRVWTKGRPKRLGRTRVPITIMVAAPVPVDADADALAVTADLRVLMQRMLHEAQETYPDRPGPGGEDWWLPARLGGSAPTPDDAAQLDRDERRARIAQAKEARDRAADRRRGGTP